LIWLDLPPGDAPGSVGRHVVELGRLDVAVARRVEHRDRAAVGGVEVEQMGQPVHTEVSSAHPCATSYDAVLVAHRVI
jgi:hypothetical protein